MKLSRAQARFLAETVRGPYRTPFVGGRSAGRIACAWYRTAASLARLGLVRIERTGDAQTAHITNAGKQAG